jgi:hypothetical protein
VRARKRFTTLAQAITRTIAATPASRVLMSASRDGSPGPRDIEMGAVRTSDDVSRSDGHLSSRSVRDARRSKLATSNPSDARMKAKNMNIPCESSGSSLA